MKKRLVIYFLVVVMLLGIPAQATGRAATGAPSLSFDGTTANCGITIWGETNDEIEVTMSLWRGNFMVESWYKEDTGYLRMNESVVVASGFTYRLEVLVTINGVEHDVPHITKECE